MKHAECSTEVALYKLLLLLLLLLEVTEPSLARKRKRPGQYEYGDAAPEYHSDVKAHYRQIYYDFLDWLIMGITDRFDQPGHAVQEELQETC